MEEKEEVEVVDGWEGAPFLGGSLGNEVTPSAENCLLFTLAYGLMAIETHTHTASSCFTN